MNEEHSNSLAQIILDRLDDQQRAFILKMAPTQEEQRLTKHEFDNIEPGVDAASPTDWPDVYWFGGMRANFGPGSHRYTYSFRFNEVGLEVREALVAQPPDSQQGHQ